MTFKGILAGFGKALKWGLLALLSIYGLLIAINLVDEEPSPELTSLMAAPPVKNVSDNGYLALVGMNAPVNEDVIKYGAQWVEAFNAATDSNAVKVATSRFPVKAIPFKGDEKLLCDPRKTACLPQAKAQAEFWKKLAADNEVLLTLRHQLTSFSSFDETYIPTNYDSPILGYGRQSRLLTLDLMALDAAEGRVEPAIVALDAQIASDRRMLEGSRSLITGMVATAWLGQDYALLNEIIATRSPVLASERARLERMTEPFKDEQIRVVAGRLFEGETRFMTSSFSKQFITSSTPGFSSDLINNDAFIWATKPLFKPNASLNLIARNYSTLKTWVISFNPRKSDEWVTLAEEDAQKDFEEINSWRILYNLYNPVGKTMVQLSRTSYEGYFLRLYDLVGISRLARLQMEVQSAGNSESNVNALVAANKDLYDPYKAQPMGWDTSTRQLSFELHGVALTAKQKKVVAGI